MACRYCGRKEGHENACPSVANRADPAQWLRLWQRGYDDGRAYKAIASQDATYLLGYARGSSAADAAANLE